jgi:hypothetical protein
MRPLSESEVEHGKEVALWKQKASDSKHGMVLDFDSNESARKLVAWLKFIAFYIEAEAINQEYDGASDAFQGPCTFEGFNECLKDHLSDHPDTDDTWSEEFCMFCHAVIAPGEFGPQTARQYEDTIERLKGTSCLLCGVEGCDNPNHICEECNSQDCHCKKTGC